MLLNANTQGPAGPQHQWLSSFGSGRDVPLSPVQWSSQHCACAGDLVAAEPGALCDAPALGSSGACVRTEGEGNRAVPFPLALCPADAISGSSHFRPVNFYVQYIFWMIEIFQKFLDFFILTVEFHGNFNFNSCNFIYRIPFALLEFSFINFSETCFLFSCHIHMK